MRWTEKFAFDRGACILVDVAKEILCKYINYTADDAERTLEKFITKYDNVDENYVHHNSAWHLATAAHCVVGLNGKLGDHIQWEVDHKLRNAPKEVNELIRKRYWEGV